MLKPQIREDISYISVFDFGFQDQVIEVRNSFLLLFSNSDKIQKFEI